MAAGDDPLVTHCVELLASLGAVRSRRMFGGFGFYVDGIFLAVIVDRCLCLKTDAASAPAFAAAGSRPFTFDAQRGSVTTSYFSAPDAAMESPEAMRPWARLALEAALRVAAARSPRKRVAAMTRRRPAPKKTRRPS